MKTIAIKLADRSAFEGRVERYVKQGARGQFGWSWIEPVAHPVWKDGTQIGLSYEVPDNFSDEITDLKVTAR